MSYHLAYILDDHGNECRGICSYSGFDGGVVTCSFDKTIKVWKLNKDKSAYNVEKTLIGHDDFVIQVCEMNKNIISISHDGTLIEWDVDKGVGIRQTEAHEKSISSLYCSETTGLIYTGSWDHKAKVWKGKDLVRTLVGNTSNILCILELENGDCAVGCGDSTIRIYRGDKQIKGIKYHTSSVRSLINIPSLGFMSVSNDGNCNLYTMSGEKIDSFYAHENLIYRIRRTKDGRLLTCSEDQTIKIWKDKKLIQKLEHPTTMWDCVELSNGDIAGCCANGKAYIWSIDPKKVVSETQMKDFLDAIRKMKEKKSGIDIKGLPKADVALNVPGKKNGEVKLVNVNGSGKAYKWNGKEWELIGDIVDQPGFQESSQKQKRMFEGKEYDFVWPVELDVVETGQTKYNLAYNMSEDPWEAAQKFIHKYNISQSFLETIAKFIVKNSGQENSSFSSLATGQIFDPFVSDNKKMEQSNTELEEEREKTHFPVTKFTILKKGKWSVILKKIKEFNEKSEDKKLDAEELKVIEKILNKPNEESFEKQGLNLENFDSIFDKKLLQWDVKYLFPVLDFFRLILISKEGVDYYEKKNVPLLHYILKKCFNEKTTNIKLQITGLKCLINLCSIEKFKKNLTFTVLTMIKVLKFIVVNENVKLNIKFTTIKLFQNILIMLQGNDEEKMIGLKCEILGYLNTLFDIFNKKKKEDYLYFILQLYGNLLCEKGLRDNEKFKESLQKLNIFKKVKKLYPQLPKLVVCKEQLEMVINNLK